MKHAQTNAANVGMWVDAVGVPNIERLESVRDIVSYEHDGSVAVMVALADRLRWLQVSGGGKWTETQWRDIDMLMARYEKASMRERTPKILLARCMIMGSDTVQDMTRVAQACVVVMSGDYNNEYRTEARIKTMKYGGAVSSAAVVEEIKVSQGDETMSALLEAALWSIDPFAIVDDREATQVRRNFSPIYGRLMEWSRANGMLGYRARSLVEWINQRPR